MAFKSSLDGLRRGVEGAVKAAFRALGRRWPEGGKVQIKLQVGLHLVSDLQLGAKARSDWIWSRSDTAMSDLQDASRSASKGGSKPPAEIRREVGA